MGTVNLPTTKVTMHAIGASMLVILAPRILGQSLELLTLRPP